MNAVRHPRWPGFAGPAAARAWGGRLPLRAVALLAATILAYNYSLQTLLRGITLQTPLGYLALVPLLALVLAWMRLAREPAPLPIHDRQIDYIVGLTLLAAAGGIALAAPAANTFWLNRLDLLGLPFFVAGLIALLYGVRRMWTLKFPILFLLLAWPVPYAPLIGDGMQAFTDVTVSAVSAVSQWITFAQPVANDPASFVVGSGPAAFLVSVGSACSGVNSLVGFIIVGGAFAYAVRGPVIRRSVWLVGGLVVIWLLNVIRIEAIFLIGAAFGEEAAIDVLHPIAGLIVFNLGVLGMLAAIRPMGLQFMNLTPPSGGALRGARSVTRIRVPMAIAIALALSFGLVNAGYARFETISSDLGEAKLQPFAIAQVAAPGWVISNQSDYPQARQYFGLTATWDRVRYSATSSASLHASMPVYLDVITTDDQGSFAAYNLVACYTFHGYDILVNAPIDLGFGLKGQILDYHNPKLGNDWSAIAWEWPYANGARTSYERIVLFLSNGPSGKYRGSDPSAPTGGVSRFAATDQFLVSMARVVIGSHLERTASR
jgi:exosortase